MDRIKKGTRCAFIISTVFSLIMSAVIYIFAPSLMKLFVSDNEISVIKTGVEYLRIEGAFYVGIGILFLLYGYYRGIGRPEWSIVLTVASLGTRVLLAYTLSPLPTLGEKAIWWSIVIGWVLADLVGFIAMRKVKIKKEA